MPLRAEFPSFSPLAQLLHEVYVKWAGNMHLGDHLPETWNAVAEAATDKLLNTPELRDFTAGVMLEALHQRARWGSAHDAGKQPEDWFWLLGYLAGKALHAHKSGDAEKALHHTISSAAALANWHSSILGLTDMRPGIDPGGDQS